MVMSSYAVAAFIVRMGMHRAARRIGEVGVLTASLFIAGATYMLVPLVSEAPLLALVAFLLGIGLGCAQPLTILLTYNHAPEGRSGEALGMRLTVNKLTQIAVPLTFGAIGSAFSCCRRCSGANGVIPCSRADSCRWRAKVETRRRTDESSDTLDRLGLHGHWARRRKRPRATPRAASRST